MLGSVDAMSQGTIALVVVVCIVIAGYGFWVVRRMILQRNELEAFAGAHGWSYQLQALGLVRQLGGEPFENGTNATATHLMQGSFRGVLARVYQFSYDKATFMPLSGNNPARVGEDDFAYSIATVLLPGDRFPYPVPMVQVKPEGVRTRLRAALGRGDVQLGMPAFDERFHVATDDPRAAQYFLTAQLQQWMLTDPRFAECPFRIAGDEIITWWPGMLDTERITPMLELCADIVAQLPGAAR